MKDMIMAFVMRPEILTTAAGVLATLAVWAWQTIPRYADRKWTQRAKQLTPLAVDAWLRAEQVKADLLLASKKALG